MKTISLELACHRYDIVVGQRLLPAVRGYLGDQQVKGATLLVVIDRNVNEHYGKEILSSLQGQFPDKKILILPVAGGEASKSLTHYSILMEQLLAAGVERGSWLVAIGGGVVGDLAGFCAATLLRGVKFIQVPTTLLAMVDSSVGGKTGINATAGKNLIGAFDQPSLVLADSDFLQTLPAAEISAGLAEVIKYGAIMNEEFFAWLENNMDDLVALRQEPLSHAIEQSVRMKAEVVAEDEREGGRRMILNFGHTFAHAIEAAYGYKPLDEGGILHGQAVGLGMVMAARFSGILGRGQAGMAARVEKLVRRANLPTNFGHLPPPPEPWRPDNLVATMGHDKKVSDGKLVFILLDKIGQAVIEKNITADQVENFLQTNFL